MLVASPAVCHGAAPERKPAGRLSSRLRSQLEYHEQSGWRPLLSETNRQRLQRAHRCKHARAACVPLADLSSRFSLVPPKEPRSPRLHVPSDPSSGSPQKPGRAEASHASALRAVTLPVVTPRLAAPPPPPPPRLATAPPTMISSAKLVFNVWRRGLWVPVAVRSTAGDVRVPSPLCVAAPRPSRSRSLVVQGGQRQTVEAEREAHRSVPLCAHAELASARARMARSICRYLRIGGIRGRACGVLPCVHCSPNL